MKHQIKDGKTYFTLEEGTSFPLGSETITLEEKAEFSLDGAYTRDSVVETIFASGNAAANAASVRTTETREELRNGKMVKVKYHITYGGRGQRIEQEDAVIEETKNAPKVEKPKEDVKTPDKPKTPEAKKK